MSASLLNCSSLIQAKANQLTVPDLSGEDDNVVSAQFSPLSGNKNAQYFCVDINQMADDACIGFGISEEPELRDESDDEDGDDGIARRSKRRETDGVAYFSDTGHIVSCQRVHNSYHRGKYKKGASVGVFPEYVTDKRSLVTFFRDNRPLHRQWVSLAPSSLRPTLNAWWGPIEVTFQKGPAPQLEQDNLSHWLLDKTLRVSDDRQLSLNDDIMVAPSTARAPCPLNNEYFEITMESVGPLSAEDVPICIGLTSAEVSSHTIPGTVTESVGYHGDEGKIYNSDDDIEYNLGENCKCLHGDRMGCGVVYMENKNKRARQKVIVYFTKNGDHIYHKDLNQPNAGFFPTVTLKHIGDIVSVNMQAAAPSCDFNGWIEDVAAKSDGAFTDLPEFHMPDQSKPHDFEDVEIEGKMSGVYCFAPSVGTVQASGTVSPSEPLIKPAMIQCMEAMTSERPYFTVTVTEMGYDSGLAIGITRSGQTVGTLPGYLTETAGYHCHGGVYRGSRHKNAYFKSEEYDKGDIVGCILDYSGEVYIVSFTKNGQLMGRAQVMNNRKYDLLASIGFKNMPSVVRPDWPHKITQPKPIFNQKDLNDWMKSAEVSVQGLQKFKLKNKSRKSEPQMISAPHPLSRECSFFSVKILSRRSKKKGPTIGISNHSHVPRTNSNYLDVSFFTHRNDIIMKSRSRIPSVNHLDIPAGFTNDTIGCGIVYPDPEQTDERVQQFVTVYFTVNGSVVFHEIVEQPHGGLYPTLTTQVYGDELEINTNFKAPSLPEKDAWNEKAFEKIKQHKVLVKALHKETDESRLARPASPVERPPSHLNKLKVYITCDAERWNEATYVKAGLDSYGFNSMLLPQARVAKGSIELDMEPRIKTCQVIVMCITPQYCNSKHAPIELKLAKKYNKPILLAVMEKTEWPPAGNIQDTLQYLTMYRIEMYSDFTWGIEQLEKHLVDVKGKGYNAVEFHVSEGEGARLLYTDAQNASRRNEKTDPNALKKAIADADKRKAQGFGNMDDSSPTRKQANVQRNSKACTIL